MATSRLWIFFAWSVSRLFVAAARLFTAVGITRTISSVFVTFMKFCSIQLATKIDPKQLVVAVISPMSLASAFSFV